MGVDTTLRYQEFYLKDEWIDEKGEKFKEAWEKECEQHSDLRYYWDDLDYHSGGRLELQEYYCKRYEHDVFGQVMSKYLRYGFLELETEGDLWAMKWDDKGYTELDAVILWDPNYYELFLDNYKDTMPKELLEKLELWWGANQI